MPMRLSIIALPGLAAIGMAALTLSLPAIAAPGTEAARVIKEACGDEPKPECVTKLRKACRTKLTLRCYYARKRQIDGPDSPDTPEKADERDDRSIFYDE